MDALSDHAGNCKVCLTAISGEELNALAQVKGKWY